MPRLEGVMVSEEKDKAAQLCGLIFRTASILKLDALQSLAVDKLKAL